VPLFFYRTHESKLYFVIRIIMSFLLPDKNRFKKILWQRCFAFLLLIFECIVLNAQHENQIPLKRCPVKTINFEQGLMNSSITSAITDETGYTWFSTKTGLQRYNGYTLETITPVADGDTIHINYPVFFQGSRNNSILIGYKKGVLEFNPENNSFKKIVSLSPASTLHYSIVPVKENDEGTWCLQENKGIIIYDAKGMVTYQFSADEAARTDNILRSEDLFQNNKIITANDDFIFIRLSSEKILQFNIKTKQLKNLDYPGEVIYGLACNKEKIFFSSKDNVSCIRISDGSVLHRFLYKNIVDGAVNFSTLDLTADNHLLVSVEKHLFEFDTSCTCRKEITNLNSEVFVTTGTAPFIYQDKFRRVWLLTLDDIKRIQNVEVPFEHLIYPKEKNNFVRSIYADEEKHLLIAGCYNGGIQLYDSSGKPLWEKPLITGEVKDVIAIEKLSGGNYLVVTLREKLYILNIETKQLHAIDLSNPSCAQLNIVENAYSNSLQRIDDSTVYISTRSNVFRCVFKKNEIQSASLLLHAPQLYNYPVSCFIYGSDKTLWVGTEPGLIFRLDEKGSLKTINIPENYFVKCMAEDAMHNIWAGTEKGIFIFSASGKLLTHVTKETGLLNDIIYALLPVDNNNNFFASTHLGLSFISKDGKINNYTKELGLQEDEFNTQSCARSSAGKLYFGGINGITAFYPGALLSVNDTPDICITRLVVNDSLYNSFGGAWRSDSITLAYNQNHFQFDIAAIGLLNPNEYVYKYRLYSFEEPWQTTHQPTSIRYTLQPGNYILEINCSPILSPNSIFSKKIYITINVPWWQTWWFRIIAFAVLVSLTALIVLRYNRQKYQKKIQALQLQTEIQNERERISKELHDNIGTQLSYISSNVDWMLDAPVSFSREEEMKRLSAVNKTAKEMISDLRETIWAMKKESVQLDDLADKLKLFIQSQRILKPAMQINIKEDIQHTISFSPTEALNIFRICQEAIGNCIKHSGASLLNITIRSGTKANFLIAIEDNGKGFLQNIEYKNHYGLENMRIRAHELGAKFSILSEEGKGTRITLAKT
jgi:signal transduction histidine kinase